MQLIKLAQKAVDRSAKGKVALHMMWFLSKGETQNDADEVIILFGEYSHVETMRRIPPFTLCEVGFETKLRYGKPSQEVSSIKPIPPRAS
jgi:hypothetical protein